MGLHGNVKKRRFRKRGGAKKKKTGDISAEAQNVCVSNDDHAARSPSDQQELSSIQHYSIGYGMRSRDYTSLDPNLLSYILKIQEDLNQMQTTVVSGSRLPNEHGIDDDMPPPPVLLARNALSELQSRIHEVAMDPNASRILESLLQVANDETVVADSLTAMLSLGSARIAVLAQHRCGSHVLEALVSAVSASSASLGSVQKAMNGLVKLLSDWDLDTLLTVMNNPCGSHVLRVFFASLAGLPIEEPREAKIDDSEPGKIRTYVERLRKSVPEEWLVGIKHSLTCLLSRENSTVLEGLPWETSSSTALQSLVAAASCVDLAEAEKLVKAALGNQLSDLVYHPCGSRFVERAVACLGPSIVWNEVKGHLQDLVNDPRANFVAQRVFLGLKGRGQIMSVWDEVEDVIPTLLGVGSARGGVVLALLKSTEVEGDEVCQRRANRCVSKALGVTGNNAKDLIGVLLTGSVDAWVHWRETIKSCGPSGLGIRGSSSDVLQLPRSLPYLSTIGMLTARCLLRYSGGAGQNARDAMATLTQLEILALCGNPVGSRLLEQWMDLDSGDGQQKNTVRFISSVLSSGSTAVCAAAKSPYGTQLLSRSVPRAPRNVQKQIMDILASNLSELKNHRYGTVVIRKCRVEQYVRGNGKWMKEGSTIETRHRLFADILNDEGTVKNSSSTNTKAKSKKSRR